MSLPQILRFVLMLHGYWLTIQVHFFFVSYATFKAKLKACFLSFEWMDVSWIWGMNGMVNGWA